MRTIVGSFWNDVKNAVLTVTLVKPTNQFIKAAHLEPLVKLAATSVATIYGGPAAGAAAGALSPLVMNLGVDDKKKAAAAQADVHGVKVLAQQAGPQMAQAADIAHSAIENTATAYQIAQIVKDARAGNPQAQQTLAHLQAAAAQGDSRAKKALQAADMIDLAQQEAPPGSAPVGAWQQIAGVVVGCAACEAQSMWHAAVGTAIDDLRERARSYAMAKSGNAAGVIQTADGRFQTRGFPSLDAAIDWLQRSTSRRGDFVYAAAYEKSADGAAYIQDEEFGSAVAPTVSGGAYGGAAYAAG